MQSIQLTPYLNFDGTCEEAMNFYARVFQAPFVGTLTRMKDVPGATGLQPEWENRVVNVGLALGNQILMGSDILPSMGDKFVVGDNQYIHITAPSRETADRWAAELADGGLVEMPMADQFWGDYYGSLKDRYGTCWMISHNPQRQ